MLRLGALPSASLLASAYRSSTVVKFNAPTNLTNAFPDGVENSPAFFGSPGGLKTISGEVIYAAAEDHDACKEYTAEDVADWPPNGIPVIVMVDRGDCTFVTKVRNVQNAGSTAVAVIVVDNVDERNLPIMADDGFGQDIRLPSMLIRKADGDIIKQYMRFKVSATLKFNVPHPDGRVEWSMFTTSHDDPAANFKNVFGTVVEALGESQQFTPYYYIDVNCTSECETKCINDGKYCHYNDDAHDTGVTGKQVVEENLRQLCFWETYIKNSTEMMDHKWFEYAKEFQKTCYSSQNWGAACSDTVITTLGFDPTPVADCVANSFDADGYNRLLNYQYRARLEVNVFISPMLFVNGAPYFGSLSCPEGKVPGSISFSTCFVFGQICAGYSDETIPKVCETPNGGCVLGSYRDDCGACRETDWVVDECGDCFTNADEKGYNMGCADCSGVPNGDAQPDNCQICNGPGHDKCGNCFPLGDKRRIEENSDEPCGGSEGFPVYGVVLIVLGIIVVVGVAVFFVMRKKEDAMRSDVDDLLKQYLPMSDGGAAASHAVPTNN